MRMTRSHLVGEEQQGPLHQRTPEETSRQKRDGPHSPARQGKASFADEELRLDQAGPARLVSLQAEGVGSEETWHQGRPLHEYLALSLLGLRLFPPMVVRGSCI
ncbi:hypothetical protein Efla_005738 [Eimeria flavescens]